MPVERPAGRPGRGNSLLMSALRFAGYDLDNRPTTPPTKTTTITIGAASASAGSVASSPSSISEIDPPTPQAGAVSAGGRYMHALPADVESTRILLQEYSGIPADEVDRHVYRMVRNSIRHLYVLVCAIRGPIYLLYMHLMYKVTTMPHGTLQAQSEDALVSG